MQETLQTDTPQPTAENTSEASANAALQQGLIKNLIYCKVAKLAKAATNRDGTMHADAPTVHP